MYVLGIVPRLEWQVKRPEGITSNCVRPMYGQYWADANGNDHEFALNLVELLKWAAMYKQPLYFEFATAIWPGDGVSLRWQKVEAEDVWAIYYRAGHFSSPWAQLLSRLYKDSLLINQHPESDILTEAELRIRQAADVMQRISQEKQ